VDLFWALKGGGPNFGVVTRYDVYTKPIGDIWYQVNQYSFDQATRILEAFASWQTNHVQDLLSNVGLVMGIDTINVALFYSAPTQKPPVFSQFYGIKPVQVLIPPTNDTFGSLATVLSGISSNMPLR
jgi:hypothetical protein